MKRLIVALVVLISAFVFPWWVTLILIAVAAFKFNLFIEGVVAGALVDFLYATHPVLNTHAVVTISAVCIVLIMTFLRKHIRYESR